MARRFQSSAVSDISGISWTSNGSHTVACWMYVASVGGGGDGIYGDISTNGSQNSQSIWLGCDFNTNWHFEEDGGAYSFTQAASLNTWTHIALTYDGTNCRAYINGSLVNTGAFTVGARAVFQYFDTGFTNDMHSQDCVVYNRALSQVEIAGLMRLSEPPMDSLFLWWPELTGAPGLDYSGKRNNWSTDGSSAGTTFPPSTFLSPGPRRIWVPASSGGLTAAGALADSSALSGSTQALVLGAAADGSALAGAAVQQQPVAGALADSSALSGKAVGAVTSALADASALAGAAIQTNAGAGSLADGSALSGSVQALAAGALADSSALLGAAVQQQPVAGALANGSALSGSANTNLNVSGAMASGSALVGAAVQQQPVAGSLASSSSLSGAAVQQQPVAGAMATGSHLQGDTSATLTATGALANSSALAGAAVQQQPITGALADGSALAGSTVALATGSLADASRLVGTSISLVAGAAASGSALAGTAVQLNLALGALASGSWMSGTATGGSAVVPFVASGWAPDLPLSGTAHGAWTNEAPVGTPQPHGAWAA